MKSSRSFLVTHIALACTIMVSLLPQAPVLAATKTYLIKQSDNPAVYLATVGKKDITRIPNAEAAIKLFGKNWAKYLTTVSKQSFAKFNVVTSVTATTTQSSMSISSLEASSACADAAVGSTCSFIGAQGELLSGSCGNPPGQVLFVCIPKN